MKSEEYQTVEHQEKLIDYTSDISETFVIKKVCDHWENYSYHQRYLDAMASIFALEGPAAAITYYPKMQRFYLSYNTNPTDKALKKKDIIQRCLNNPADPNQVKNLLFLYIAYNVDFKKSLPDGCDLFNEITGYKYSIPLEKTRDDISITVDKEDVLLKIKNLEVKKQQFNEIQLEVNNALAMLIGTIDKINEHKRSLIDPAEIEAIELKIEKNAEEQISRNKGQLIRLYNDALKAYYQILDLLSNKCIETSDKSENFYKFVKILVRPLQDTEKLSYYLKYKMNKEGLSNIEVEIIPNIGLEISKTKHAEANLGKEFIDQHDLYIGVSKLCCGLCDSLLSNKYHLNYRGTNGTCSPEWGAPIYTYIGFRDKVYEKSIGINQVDRGKQLSKQHRVLSNDDLKVLILDVEMPDQYFGFQEYVGALLSGKIDYAT